MNRFGLSAERSGAANSKSRSFFCSASLQSVLPVVRVAMKVHDGKDENAMRLDAIEHAIGETMNQAPAAFFFHFRPQHRIVESIPDASVDFDGEVKS